MKVNCSNCNKKIIVEDKRFKSYNKLEGKNKHKYFCSPECQNDFKRTGKKIKCSECGKFIYKRVSDIKRSKSGKLFCTKSCSTIYWNKHLKTGPNNPNYKGLSYRKHALRILGSKCAFCNYNNKQVIQVHHKDHNRSNNKIDNLLIVCPTHHWEIHFGIIKI